MDSLLTTVIGTTDRYRLLPANAPVLVMVSGGGDSVALLHLLASGALGQHPLRVLHVDHMLRGDHAAADARFVDRLCIQLGVEYRCVAFDVAAYAADAGLNLEDAGREIRYRFAEEELDGWLDEMRRPRDEGRIAVAHSRDDRVETFFMRAIFGSGTGALASIAPSRGRIIRPLLDCDRSDIRAWLESRGHEWREDESNADDSRTRAFVRHRLVPQAEELNPSFRASLARTMNLLADDDALLSELARTFALQFAEVEPDRVVIDRAMMGTLDRTMARRTLREAIRRGFPEASRLEAAHVEALADGLSCVDFARDLPGGLRASNEYGNMDIFRAGGEDPSVVPSLLMLPGTALLGPAGAIEATLASSHDTTGDDRSIVIDGLACEAGLVVDSMREGDRMQPLGMEGTRKLSDLLIDGKIPRRLRKAVPVVRCGEHVVWLAGVRMSERYKVGPSTTVAYRLTWRPGDDAGQ